MWQCVLNFLETQAPIISLATVILMAVYVFYTIRTFRSIHLQTELQSQAYLLVSYEIAQEDLVGISSTTATPSASAPSASLSSSIYFPILSLGTYVPPRYYHLRIESKMAELYTKWQGILSKNRPDALQREKNIILRLQNRGRSDIIRWKISLKAHIEPGKYLAREFNINGEDFEWSIEGKSSNEVIAPGDHIQIVIGKSGVFPEIIISWTIDYKDMRDKSYERFGGDRSLTDRNILADPVEPPTTPSPFKD